MTLLGTLSTRAKIDYGQRYEEGSFGEGGGNKRPSAY